MSEKTKTIIIQKPVEYDYVSITQEGLEYGLHQINGTTFVKLFTNTTPKMLKTNNPYYDNVVKESQIVCMIGFNYDNVVNNARSREAFSLAIEYFQEQFGISKKEAKKYLENLMPKATSKVTNFQSSPRKWGSHKINPITGKVSRIIIEHTNKNQEYKVYVQVWVLHTQSPVYRYVDTNKVIEKEDLESLKTFFPIKKSNAEHQGLDEVNEIIIRDYALGNVDKIHLNKQRFVIR